MNLVVDANVVVKWYVDERDSEQARRVLAAPGRIISPGHALGEIGEVLTRRVRARDIGREQLDLALDDMLLRLAFVPLGAIAEDAIGVALEAKVSFYDALHIALASVLEVPVVTADEVLVRALAGTRWSTQIIPLAEWPAQTQARQ